VVWANKGSDEQAWTTLPNVRNWHKATIRYSRAI